MLELEREAAASTKIPAPEARDPDYPACTVCRKRLAVTPILE